MISHEFGDAFVTTSNLILITLYVYILAFFLSEADSARKQMETYLSMDGEVLHILNEPGDLQDAIRRVLGALKTRTGFDAVGIRLRDGDDFPYFAQEGFSEDFLLAENTLIERDADGRVCRDSNGNVSLECACGLVIFGKTDPKLMGSANPLGLLASRAEEAAGPTIPSRRAIFRPVRTPGRTRATGAFIRGTLP